MKINQCLKISFSGSIPDDFLETYIQKNARKLHIEGTVQIVSATQINIVACGSKDHVDQFLDVLHKSVMQLKAHNIIAEPFLKAKDYRGAFRIIQ